MFHLLVTGSRKFTNRNLIWTALDEIVASLPPGPLTLIHGHCPDGADHLANGWALNRRYRQKLFPADWRTHGLAAGPIRNGQMVPLCDVVAGFPLVGCVGTLDCLKKAAQAGKPGWIFLTDTWCVPPALVEHFQVIDLRVRGGMPQDQSSE